MNKLQSSLVALAAAATLSVTTMAPAFADSAASTRNIMLGVAALAGFAIESNASRKNAQAHNVSGYLSDGSTVYGDGHVVTRNGYSYYPGNNGQNVSCSNGNCYVANINGGPASDHNDNANNRRYTSNVGRSDSGQWDNGRSTNGQWDNNRNRDGDPR